MFVLTVRRKIRSSDTLHEFLGRYYVIFNWISGALSFPPKRLVQSYANFPCQMERIFYQSLECVEAIIA